MGFRESKVVTMSDFENNETTLITPNAENGDADKLFADARDFFERASGSLSEMLQKLDQGDFGDAGDVKRIVAQLEKASEMSLAARIKLDERNKKHRGVAHDFAIDFDAARAEIGRRLACLRDA